ncbi:ANTAR domain-containing protein [Mycobacterium bourgelatii]|uniref:ANTAR domain-containing protein n=1 Tax=Mycobacterium bourgelatii TaxID=1273442 RepID=UPI0013D6CDEC|nr:ANTAR domain-containing protein [Mycobacterium bourgelatii]MCV6973748.1 ANTAR domain-containing protein [Mycobacterium bourgelatii]
MTSNWAPAHLSWGPDSGRILDTARGILMGVRRCHSEAAFDELHTAARRHRVPIFAMAWALVHLAGAGRDSAHSLVDAQSAARDEWGHLFAGSPVPTG